MKSVGASNVLQGVKCNGRPIAVPSMMRSKKLPGMATFYEQGVTDQAFLVRGRIAWPRTSSRTRSAADRSVMTFHSPSRWL